MGRMDKTVVGLQAALMFIQTVLAAGVMTGGPVKVFTGIIVVLNSLQGALFFYAHATNYSKVSYPSMTVTTSEGSVNGQERRIPAV